MALKFKTQEIVALGLDGLDPGADAWLTLDGSLLDGTPIGHWYSVGITPVGDT
jgi:hypothetical protein